jgi:hypothetical protein
MRHCSCAVATIVARPQALADTYENAVARELNSGYLKVLDWSAVSTWR